MRCVQALLTSLRTDFFCCPGLSERALQFEIRNPSHREKTLREQSLITENLEYFVDSRVVMLVVISNFAGSNLNSFMCVFRRSDVEYEMHAAFLDYTFRQTSVATGGWRRGAWREGLVGFHQAALGPHGFPCASWLINDIGEQMARRLRGCLPDCLHSEAGIYFGRSGWL